MDVRQLNALVTVADTGSVTKAAQLLRLVQPAVTRQIRSLEDELGVPLFERTRQGMRPTDAGTALVERARRALTELERARAEIQPNRGEVTGIASVGILGSVVDLLVEPLADVIARRYPGIDLRVSTAYSGHLQQWLDAGDLDLSLVYNLSNTPSLRVRPLVKDYLWAVAPPEAHLQVGEPIDLAEVLLHPFIMPIAGHGIRVLIDQARVESDVKPNISVQANSLTLQKLLVKAGRGWTILPAPGVAADVARGVFSAAPLRNPEISRTIMLGLPHAGRIPPAVEVVATELVKLIRTSVTSGKWPSAHLQDEEPRET